MTGGTLDGDTVDGDTLDDGTVDGGTVDGDTSDSGRLLADVPTEQVRIVGAERAGEIAGAERAGEIAGAERAGEIAGAEPSASDPSPRSDAAVRTPLDDLREAPENERELPEPFGPEDWAEPLAAPEEPLLLHWTEAPTGEVPAVLSRGGLSGEDPWASLPEPSWREERSDWASDEAIVPSLRPGAEGPGPFPGSLSGAHDDDRQPWSFEIGAQPASEPTRVVTGIGAIDDADPASSFDDDDDHGGRPDDLDDSAGPDAWIPVAPEEALTGDAEPTRALDRRDIERGGSAVARPGSDAGSAEKTSLLRLPRPRSGERSSARSGPRGARGEPRGARGGLQGVLAPDRDAEASEALAADLAARGRGRLRWAAMRDSGARPPAGPALGAGGDAMSRRAGRNIPVAIATGVAIGALALLAFAYGTIPSMVVVTAVLSLAAMEGYGAFRRAGYRPATLLGLVAIVGLMVGTYDRDAQALPAVLVLLVAATFVWHLAGVDRRADPVRSTGATLLVFCWVGVFGSYAALLLSPSLFPDRTGIAYLLGAVIAAVAYDVGALAIGAGFGRHPLSSVSPGKTWEGLVGGGACAIVLAVAVVHLIHPWTLGEAAVLGAVVAVVSPIGDLCESLVKRHLGLKDMGKLLPGHGGLLDRVDGLLFVLPATYYLVRAFPHT